MAPRGLSKADIIGLVLGFLLLAPLVAQTTTQSAESRRRSVCAANLRGITQSMNVYAADNSDNLPIYAPTSATTFEATLNDEATTAKDADGAMLECYKEKRYGNNTMAGMWLLVLNGQVAPKQFICPSDTFAGTPAGMMNQDRKYYTNFQKTTNLSYSTAYPWEEKNNKVVVSSVWINQVDASLALISDMAPYLGKKAKAGEAATRPEGSKDADPIDDDWAVKIANSQNHQFEGQNIGFGDAHVEWSSTPLAGQNNDSIWGKRDEKLKKEIPIEAGTFSHAVPAQAQGASDVIMVPTRDSKGNLQGVAGALAPVPGLP